MEEYKGYLVFFAFMFFVIRPIILYFASKKQINIIGKIKCTRCSYQGKAVNLSQYSIKMGCP
jgi:hypothetical protein